MDIANVEWLNLHVFTHQLGRFLALLHHKSFHISERWEFSFFLWNTKLVWHETMQLEWYLCPFKKTIASMLCVYCPLSFVNVWCYWFARRVIHIWSFV